MKIIGFNYAKVSAERTSKWEPLEKIHTNIQFTNITRDETDVIKAGGVLRVAFTFTVIYEPKNATIALEGFVFLNTTPEIIKEAVKYWSKKKELSDDLRDVLVRFLWKKCNLKAFQLEEELNVPVHIQLPQIAIKPKAD